MAKVNENLQPQKNFIPGQVATLNKAQDILAVMQKCKVQIEKLKTQIENIRADYAHMPAAFHPQVKESIDKVTYLHNWQVLVYRRILAWYLNTIAKVYDPAIYHHMDFYRQPDALKNVEAAA